jgi:hypothetical protein
MTAALLVFVSDCRADGVYKSVDADGHVVYSDRAPSAKAQKSEVRVMQGDPAEAARAAKETQILAAEETLRKRQNAESSSSKARQDQQKQIACRNARNHYNDIKDANALFKLDEQGNRVFYSDAEGDARKEQARKAVIAACGQ